MTHVKTPKFNQMVDFKTFMDSTLTDYDGFMHDDSVQMEMPHYEPPDEYGEPLMIHCCRYDQFDRSVDDTDLRWYIFGIPARGHFNTYQEALIFLIAFIKRDEEQRS
ncbi:hypothetical protein LCGC14_0267640 [marine sediment metagenome]|uniref:Uncharacterized protein n=1 Tax=marine sediment metagenome TaxID=412755 RepID=A0A0F9X4W0_9ZZZZ